MKSAVYFIEGQIGIKAGCPTDLKARIAVLSSEYGTSLESKPQKRFAPRRAYKKEWLAKHHDIYRYIQKYTTPDFKSYFTKMVPVSNSTDIYIYRPSQATDKPIEEIVEEAISGHSPGLDIITAEYYGAVRRIPLTKRKS